MNGVFLLDKPSGITSFGAVNQIKKSLNLNKTGHTGTLDPQVEGLMLVMVNKATKCAPFLLEKKKTYESKLTLGIKSDTKDIWGEVLEEKTPKNHTFAKVDDVLQSFIGESKQIPPLYSAIKVKGKRLYEYAINKQEVEIKERIINIEEIVLKDIKDREISFTVTCSTGTYVRSLCEDIGERLGELASMSYLKRTKIDNFNLSEADSLENICKGLGKLRSIEEVLKDYPRYDVSDSQDVFNGRCLKLTSNKESLMIYYQNKIIANYFKGEDGLYYCKRGLF